MQSGGSQEKYFNHSSSNPSQPHFIESKCRRLFIFCHRSHLRTLICFEEEFHIISEIILTPSSLTDITIEILKYFINCLISKAPENFIYVQNNMSISLLLVWFSETSCVISSIINFYIIKYSNCVWFLCPLELFRL